jgi:hypothetical protein
VGSHQEELPFYLITSPRHPIVLGLTWLEAHNPIVDWCNRLVTFRELGCPRQPSPCQPMKIETNSATPRPIQDGVVPART